MAITYDREKGILFCDNTILSTFATCPLKAMISYGLDRKLQTDTNANLEVGRAIHKALEHYYLLDAPKVCLEVLRQEYEVWATTHLFDDKRLSWANIELVFKSWMDKNPQDRLPFRVSPENIEVAFGVPLNEDGSIIFTGRIDLLAHARHGSSLFAIDHKTTGQLDVRKKHEYSMTSQMTGYQWALQQMGHDISGIYINVVHTGVVPTSNRKCTTHKTYYGECGFLHLNHELLGPYHRSEEDLEAWRVDALSLAMEWRQLLDYINGDWDKLTHVMQRGKWLYQACALCPWANYCKGGQKQYWLTENTVEEFWCPGILGEMNENTK